MYSLPTHCFRKSLNIQEEEKAAVHYDGVFLSCNMWVSLHGSAGVSTRAALVYTGSGDWQIIRSVKTGPTCQAFQEYHA